MGSDFNGVSDELPAGMEKILGGNSMRVLRAVEDASAMKELE